MHKKSVFFGIGIGILGMALVSFLAYAVQRSYYLDENARLLYLLGESLQNEPGFEGELGLDDEYIIGRAMEIGMVFYNEAENYLIETENYLNDDIDEFGNSVFDDDNGFVQEGVNGEYTHLQEDDAAGLDEDLQEALEEALHEASQEALEETPQETLASLLPSPQPTQPSPQPQPQQLQPLGTAPPQAQLQPQTQAPIVRPPVVIRPIDGGMAVNIPANATATEFAIAAQDAGVVANTMEFLEFLSRGGYTRRLVAGDFEIPLGASMEDIVGIIVYGN